ASVAVPRLAGTKADAEISAAVANLRTLVNDANVYYVAKGGFGTAPDIAKWNEVTNVPLKDHGGVPVTTELATREAYLYVGDDMCIGVTLHNEAGTIPARIVFTTANSKVSSVCQKVRDAEPIKAYTKSELIKGLTGTMPIGSSIKLKR
ncbi:MAG: hypothetical protein SOZ73_07985, partial [Campylobacter sp.]|nr:hypothetical protein [Campylobacter sp.]